DKRSHLSSISRFPHSLTACKLVSSLVYFVSFKRFLLSVCSSSNWEVKLLLCKKKRPLGLGSSHPIYLPVKSHFLILIFTFDTYISYEFICYWNSVTYA